MMRKRALSGAWCFGTLVLLLSVAAAAGAQTKNSLYERLGGKGGITAVVEDFRARVLKDPRGWPRAVVMSASPPRA